MEALRYKPSRLWFLDDTSPFQDYSGYDGTATLTGTEKRGIGLTSDVEYSQVVQSGTTISFDSPAYRAGREADDFTLMVSILPLKRTTVGSQQVLSNSGLQDGITVNGTTVSFSTAYTSTGEAKCSYNFQYLRRLDVVAVHTRSKNSLYVNGVLVDEADISAEQQADTYNSPDNNLYSGNTTSSQGLMLNAVGVFMKALTDEEIMRLHVMNNKRNESGVPEIFGGQSISISSETRHPYLNVLWNSAEQWSLGTLKSVSVDDDTLVPDRYDDLTMPGTWEDSIDLRDGLVDTPIDSINMTWVGENLTVEASVDGTTWITVERGKNLSIIPTGFDPTGKTLLVKVSFTPDVESGFLERLVVRGYIGNTYVPDAGRTITYTNPAATLDEYREMTLHEDWGVNLEGGTIAFSADDSDLPIEADTIEFWMKKNDGTTPTISFSGTQYINGGTATSIGVGEWAVYHIALASPANTFSISGNVTIGKFAIYPSVLSASQVADIYDSYKGVISVPLDDTSVVTVTNSVDEPLVYEHDWAIIAS